MSDMTDVVIEGGPSTVVGTTSIGRFSGVFRGLRRSPAGFIGFLIVALLVLITVIGPFFTPEVVPDVKSIMLPAGSPGHLLGTDNEGKDVLIQMIDGGRAVIFIGFAAAVISTIIAIVLGSLAAYLGGWVDSVVVTAADVALTIPTIVLLAVLGAMFKLDSPILLAILVGGLAWPVLTRAIRSLVLSLKEREFVEAAGLLDLGTIRVIFVEILPNMASFILMNFMIAVSNAIYALVGLYLLGLAPLTGSNWGIMLNRAWIAGAIFNEDSLAFILSPIVAIVLLLLGLVMMTRSLEEILNPRLRDR